MTIDASAPRGVIITGGGTGIGRSAARAFADDGARVLIVGRTASTLVEAAKDYPAIVPLEADVTDPRAADLIVETALSEIGRIDVLVNNAAVSGFGTLAETERAQAEAQFATNLLAPLMLTRRALDALEETRGVVINISTAGSLGLRPWPGNGVYGASKVALDFLTRTWAAELGPRGIRVVGVAPGVTDTGIGVRSGMTREAYDGFLAQMGERTPVGRVGDPEEIAWWITRLAAPASGYVTGTVIPVDGGLSLT
ncbi:SDR family NAD(P)-dependent oxidoreductase [Streptomyces griseus]|uniref:SDR family NAD(P)-dependent oxidoreductase n=1 Tax=Streptomyces griseus TaxID=1911 RepID=UPI0018FECD7B|nr:SDR family oxidoreductase [Streptomyces griseus]